MHDDIGVPRIDGDHAILEVGAVEARAGLLVHHAGGEAEGGVGDGQHVTLRERPPVWEETRLEMLHVGWHLQAYVVGCDRVVCREIAQHGAEIVGCDEENGIIQGGPDLFEPLQVPSGRGAVPKGAGGDVLVVTQAEVKTNDGVFDAIAEAQLVFKNGFAVSLECGDRGKSALNERLEVRKVRGVPLEPTPDVDVARRVKGGAIETVGCQFGDVGAAAGVFDIVDEIVGEGGVGQGALELDDGREGSLDWPVREAEQASSDPGRDLNLGNGVVLCVALQKHVLHELVSKPAKLAKAGHGDDRRAMIRGGCWDVWVDDAGGLAEIEDA